ncbi:MAG: DUF3883 domain-containing protein [Pseudomonadota bacterium]|nr:DUF3883 domain-containing protein [Pseudomonadota bacterium]
MSRINQGAAAEEIAVAHERLRLGSENAGRLKYVGNRHGMGFDIQSCNSSADSSARFIEVKSSSENGYVFLTERERANLSALGASAWLYIVDVHLRKVIKTIQNPISLIEIDGTALTYKIKI